MTKTTKPSPVWNYFKGVGDTVFCNKCPKTYTLATAKSSTQPLLYHLRSCHDIVLNKKRAADDCDSDNSNLPNTKKQKKIQPMITSYIEKKTQQQMYAELAAVDRSSFNQIANSTFIHSAMRDKGMKAHISHVTVRSKVFEYYEQAKSVIKNHLQQGVNNGQRYAVTFDEYTGKNRRYLTVNIHSTNGVWFNLGMVRVWNSQTSEPILELVRQRLAEFDLTFDHIVAFVTDGASIMMKLGRLAPCEFIVTILYV